LGKRRRVRIIRVRSASPLSFVIPLAFIVCGFVIGGRDGAIISIVGCVALLGFSIWVLIKIGREMGGQK